MLHPTKDIIVSIATAPGHAAIGVVRLSGAGSIALADKMFSGRKKLNQLPGYSMAFGKVIDPQQQVIDEVLVSVFRAPHSYTGEDAIEISGHGSPYVLQQIVSAAIALGARQAKPGEYTQRAFLNGKLDLAQAEAVADLIHAESQAAHHTALHQMRGGYSQELNELRNELINFVALIELELDFAEEDVAFADRKELTDLVAKALAKTLTLKNSFALGNVIKKGVSVAIIGKPNAGKSTLLNALLNDQRAIVSDIAGTTRDTIEETLVINGLLFRLIDTAGIREHTQDTIEQIGIARSKENAAKADIILHLIDLIEETQEINPWLEPHAEKTITLYSKWDEYQKQHHEAPLSKQYQESAIAAKEGWGIERLKDNLYQKAMGKGTTDATVVTNARHYDALVKVQESLEAIRAGLLSGLSGDLLTVDVRRCLHYLGEITGQVEVDRDILGAIFGKFCIGK